MRGKEADDELLHESLALAGWLVAGDETSDAEPLLGQIVRAEMHLTDGAQGDLLKGAA